MTIAHVSSGEDADPDQYNDVADGVNNLSATVLTTGGTINDHTLTANVGWKQSSGSTSSNGRVTITHGLGFTPRIVATMAGSGGPYSPYIISPTSTQFIVQFYGLASGAAAASGQSVTFNWIGLPVSGELS